MIPNAINQKSLWAIKEPKQVQGIISNERVFNLICSIFSEELVAKEFLVIEHELALKWIHDEETTTPSIDYIESSVLNAAFMSDNFSWYAVKEPVEAKGLYISAKSIANLHNQHKDQLQVRMFSCTDFEEAKDWMNAPSTEEDFSFEKLEPRSESARFIDDYFWVVQEPKECFGVVHRPRELLRLYHSHQDKLMTKRFLKGDVNTLFTWLAQEGLPQLKENISHSPKMKAHA